MPEESTRTIKLPSLTTEMDQAELLEWLVSRGDEVREGDPLAEVTTDKVDMELESPYSGTITELLEEAGAVLEVGAPLATILTSGGGGFDLGLGGDEEETTAEPGDAATTAQEEQADAAAGTADTSHAGDAEGGDAATSRSSNGRVPAPPGVRRRAAELGIDLAGVEPTGSRGQVTLDDVAAFAAADEGDSPPRQDEQPAAADRDAVDAPAPRSSTSGSGSAARGDGPTPHRARAHPPVDDRTARRRRSVRAATARSTTRSQGVPQFTLFRSADLTQRAERRGRVSWTTIIARATAGMLWRHPELNASWDDEQGVAVPREGVRIGLAVDTPTGLVVVGLDDPDRVAPATADERLRAAAERARDGKLQPDEMQGCSATVSNLGGFGVERFTALLVPPQAAILSVGTVTERPAVVNGGLAVRLQVDLGLTVDHRVADGADGARALQTLVELLEDG